jgi:hypothetical protein
MFAKVDIEVRCFVGNRFRAIRGFHTLFAIKRLERTEIALHFDKCFG